MPGRVFGGRYTVQDKIGTGGMAIVYRGLDQVLGRTVAIKTMLPQYAADPSFAARFKQEAQAAAALQSPYIVSVYDWGKDGDTYYIIMEYLRGTDLKSGIRKHGALDCRKVAQIGSQIAQALSVAHRHDIIHRDIKPQNIMVQPDGNIKVMDFGIARAKNSHLTQDNSVLGTAHYVSPEQTQGKELGPTTDIYSLGIVMYESATGRVPFDGDDAITVALKQVNEQPIPPSRINPRVDPALESIILKCMQKDPKDRFQTADQLYHVLRDYLAGRLQAVNTATSVVNPVVGQSPVSNRNKRAGANHVRSNTPSGRGGANPYTQQNQAGSSDAASKKKGRRRVAVAVAVIVAIVAVVAAIAVAVIDQTSTRAVPNLVGLTEDEAISQIQQTGYFTEGTVKEDYSDTAPEGQVIDQDPDGGNQASQGTAINLVVSKGAEPAQDVTVPDLTNMDASEANQALANVGLVGKAGDSVYSSTIEQGKVAQQDPAANSTAKAGDTVTYQLSKGVETVQVPSVVGMTESAATKALQNAGFSVVTNSASSDSYDAGVVSYQSVTGSAAKGSQVVITISTGSKNSNLPDVTGMTEAEAESELSSAGFTVRVRQDYSGSGTAGTVVWQSPDPGSATTGSTVTIGVATETASNTSTTTNTSSSSNTNTGGSGSTSESGTTSGGSEGGSTSSTTTGE